MPREPFTDLGHVLDALDRVRAVHDEGDAMHAQAAADAAAAAQAPVDPGWEDDRADG